MGRKILAHSVEEVYMDEHQQKLDQLLIERAFKKVKTHFEQTHNPSLPLFLALADGKDYESIDKVAAVSTEIVKLNNAIRDFCLAQPPSDHEARVSVQLQGTKYYLEFRRYGQAG